MRKVTGLGLNAALITLLACGALIGCGDDESESEAGSGGTAGTTGGSGGTGDTDGGAGTSGGSGGTGGSGGSGGAGGGLPMITCTEELPTTPLTCGGTECPMPMTIMGFDTCQRPCCVADACGTKSAIEGMESECGAPPPPDQRCPDYTDMLGTMREGCCNDMNQCGAVSTLTNACVTESPLIADLPATPQACDAEGDDAGAP